MTTQAKRIPPAGDTPRKMADAINQHADYLNVGLFQSRTVAQLADETHEGGRSFYCPDETNGPCLVVSTGTTWNILTLGAVAS